MLFAKEGLLLSELEQICPSFNCTSYQSCLLLHCSASGLDGTTSLHLFASYKTHNLLTGLSV
jgi:hypothetical protein